MKTVNCEGVDYLAHESIGGAALWIRPLALHYCFGRGLDIGYSKPEWQLPGSTGIEPDILSCWHAMKLPYNQYVDGQWDYIHSSHCLEHVKENWYNVLDYWLTKIKVGGILFLYLPHASQNYWQPRNNRKHIHSFTGQEIEQYLKGLGHQVFVSGVDANHSFTVICEKKETRKAGWKTVTEKEFNDLPSLQDVLSMPDKSTQEDRDILFGNGNDVKLPGCFDKSKFDSSYILHGHLNMTDEQHKQALADGEELRKSLNEFGYIRPEIKPTGYKCEINESRWFEQNTEDLANKIADMRMESEAKESTVKPVFTYKTYIQTEHDVWFNFNIERQKLNLSPIKEADYLKLIGR